MRTVKESPANVWLRSAAARPAVLLALVAAEVAAIAYFTFPGYFVQDDYIYLQVAQRQRLSLGYLAQPEGNHLSPGTWLGYWLIQNFFPLNFGVADALLLACFAASAFLLYWILAELFRPGPATLVLTLLYGTSLVHVGIAPRWSGGIHSLPAAAFSLLAILAYLRFHRTSSRRLLALSVAAFALALLFYIKPLLVPLYLVLLRVLVLQPGRSLSAAFATAAREWRVWLLYLVPTALYVAIYLGLYWQPSQAPSPGSVADYLYIAWVRAFTPSFFGFYIPPTFGGLPVGRIWSGEVAAVVAVQVAVVALVAWSLVRNRRSWRAWAFFGLAFIANALIVGLARIGDYGSEQAYHLRYYVEATYLFPIALGAAFLPVPDPSGRQRPAILASPSRWRLLAWMGVGLAIAAHLAFAWTGAQRMREESWSRAAAMYMENVKDSLQRLDSRGIQPTLIDGTVPEYVISSWFNWRAPYPYNRFSEIFRLIDPRLAFDRPAPDLFEVSDDGVLRPVAFTPQSGGEARRLLEAGSLKVTNGAVEAGEEALCVRSSAGPAPVEFIPPATPGGGEWYLEVRYGLSSGPGSPQTIPLFVDRGSGYPYLNDRSLTPEAHRDGEALIGLGEPVPLRVRLDLPSGSRTCLHRIAVGRLVPRHEARNTATIPTATLGPLSVQ